MANYDYLIPFKREYCSEGTGDTNNFYSVSNEEIQKLENYLGNTLPSDLKDFYQQIGYGFLTKPRNAPKDYSFNDSNRINDPLLIIEMLSTGEYILPEYYEDFIKGTDDIPVFEIGDSSSFMHMKPKSDNPNAVWYLGMDKIEDSFERFIYNLYHDSPDYYSRNW